MSSDAAPFRIARSRRNWSGSRPAIGTPETSLVVIRTESRLRLCQTSAMGSVGGCRPSSTSRAGETLIVFETACSEGPALHGGFGEIVAKHSRFPQLTIDSELWRRATAALHNRGKLVGAMNAVMIRPSMCVMIVSSDSPASSRNCARQYQPVRDIACSNCSAIVFSRTLEPPQRPAATGGHESPAA
jgi:hypothetical protein